jgi:hypothetical protein
MAEATYEKQFLACYAAGFISADGATVLAYGCALTRIATGFFALILEVGAGLPDDESYTLVTPKAATPVLPIVEDFSDNVKRIRIFNIFGTFTPSDIEVQLYKTVTKFAG